jgi:hypothetical protein
VLFLQARFSLFLAGGYPNRVRGSALCQNALRMPPLAIAGAPGSREMREKPWKN